MLEWYDEGGIRFEMSTLPRPFSDSRAFGAPSSQTGMDHGKLALEESPWHHRACLRDQGYVYSHGVQVRSLTCIDRVRS